MTHVQDTGYLTETPAEPLARVLLAHGAGAPMDSEFMAQLTEALVAEQLAVVRFEFPYMAARRLDGKRRPPAPFARIVSHYQRLVDHWRQQPLPLVVAGKSMGGRAAATCDTTGCLGAVAYGYPLHPAGKPERLRLQPLENRQSPLLIFQGERDKLGDRQAFDAHGGWPNVQLQWLADGDHDLAPRKRSGLTQVQHILSAARATRHFVEQRLRP